MISTHKISINELYYLVNILKFKVFNSYPSSLLLALQ